MDLVSYHPVDDLAVGGFDKAIFIDTREGRQRTDQADVRAFRRFDRAHTAIVAVVNVTDFEAGALTGETARSKGGQTALMCQLRQRVILVHKL